MGRNVNPYVQKLVAQGVNYRTAFRYAKKAGMTRQGPNAVVKRLIESGYSERHAYRLARKSRGMEAGSEGPASQPYEYSKGEWV